MEDGVSAKVDEEELGEEEEEEEGLLENLAQSSNNEQVKKKGRYKIVFHLKPNNTTFEIKKKKNKSKKNKTEEANENEEIEDIVEEEEEEEEEEYKTEQVESPDYEDVRTISRKTITYASGYVRFEEYYLNFLLSQFLVYDFKLVQLQQLSMILPRVNKDQTMSVPPSLSTQLLSMPTFCLFFHRSIYTQAVICLGVRWSFLSVPMQSHFSRILVEGLSRSDALSLGILLAFVGSPTTPAQERVLVRLTEDVVRIVFSDLTIDPILEPFNCFWLGYGMLHHERQVLFLSHAGKDAKMDLVEAIRACDLYPFAFLDCLTRPSPGTNNELFLWQNIWASDLFVHVSSPRYYKSKWCRREEAAFGIMKQIFPEEREMRTWDWHDLSEKTKVIAHYTELFEETWKYYLTNRKDSSIALFMEQPLWRRITDEFLPHASEEEIRIVLEFIPLLLPNYKEYINGVIHKYYISPPYIASHILLRLIALRDMIKLVENWWENLEEIERNWLLESCVLGIPTQELNGREEVRQNTQYSMIIRDPLKDPRWILAFLPMHIPCYIAQFRSQPIVDTTISNFSLSQAPCLTINSVEDISILLHDRSKDRRHPGWEMKDGGKWTLLENGTTPAHNRFLELHTAVNEPRVNIDEEESDGEMEEDEKKEEKEEEEINEKKRGK